MSPYILTPPERVQLLTQLTILTRMSISRKRPLVAADSSVVQLLESQVPRESAKGESNAETARA